jgi:hypothetical protein
MLTMFIELSGNASIQLGIQSWSVIPCGVGLLKIISVFELAVTHVLLIESSHVGKLHRRGRREKARRKMQQKEEAPKQYEMRINGL